MYYAVLDATRYVRIPEAIASKHGHHPFSQLVRFVRSIEYLWMPTFQIWPIKVRTAQLDPLHACMYVKSAVLTIVLKDAHDWVGWKKPQARVFEELLNSHLIQF